MSTVAMTRHKRDIDKFNESIDPATTRDARHLRAVSAARKNVEAAEKQLREAVDAARAARASWTMIGVALDTSKQDAHRKYGNSAR